MAKVNVKEQKAENISKSEDFLLKNKKTILYAVIALIVIIAGIILYNNFVKAPREAKASTELAKGQTMFANQQFALRVRPCLQTSSLPKLLTATALVMQAS